MSLVESSDVLKFVSERINNITEIGPYQALCVEKNGKIVAGVVYFDYRDGDIQIAVASDDPYWLTRDSLVNFFWYPFGQLNVRRITAFTDVNNRRARSCLEKLGFTLEGVKRGALDGNDAAMYGMLKHECRWLNEHI